jgi:hypothetical protein
MNIQGDGKETNENRARSAELGGDKNLPTKDDQEDEKPPQVHPEESQESNQICDGATAAPQTKGSSLEEVPVPHRKGGSRKGEPPEECCNEMDDEEFWSRLPAGVMPLPSASGGVLDHRSGIPGAFGVGDVCPFLSEVPSVEDDNPAAVGTIHSIPPEENPDKLITAIPVSTEEELPLQQATPDPGSQRQQNGSFLWKVILGVFGMSASMAVVVGGVCGSGFCHTTALDPPRSSGVTLAPTSLRSTRIGDFQERIMETFGGSYFQVEDDYLREARLQALDWILNSDPMQLELDAENLIQRFILAVFYYQTTRYQPWNDCNPPENDQVDTCYYTPMFLLESSPDPMVGNRWLSKLHECFWAGIGCFGGSSKNVTEIILGE